MTRRNVLCTVCGEWTSPDEDCACEREAARAAAQPVVELEIADVPDPEVLH